MIIQTRIDDPKFVSKPQVVQVDGSACIDAVVAMASDGVWEGNLLAVRKKGREEYVLLAPEDEADLGALMEQMEVDGIPFTTVLPTEPGKRADFEGPRVWAIGANKWPFAKQCHQVKIMLCSGKASTTKIPVEFMELRDGEVVKTVRFDDLKQFRQAIGETADRCLGRAWSAVRGLLGYKTHHIFNDNGTIITAAFGKGKGYLLSVFQPKERGLMTAWLVEVGDEYDFAKTEFPNIPAAREVLKEMDGGMETLSRCQKSLQWLKEQDQKRADERQRREKAQMSVRDQPINTPFAGKADQLNGRSEAPPDINGSESEGAPSRPKSHRQQYDRKDRGSGGNGRGRNRRGRDDE